MKKLWLLLCVAFSLNAEIDFTQIKGLYSIFRTKKYLSPVNGFAWWQGGQIETLYRYGDPDHKMVQLVQELFYLNPGDGITFGPTILPTKVGAHLTPAAIGEILTILDTVLQEDSLNPSEEQQLEKKLEDALNKELNFEQIINESEHKQEALKEQLRPKINQVERDRAPLEKRLAQLESSQKDAVSKREENSKNIQGLKQRKKLVTKKQNLEELKEIEKTLAEKEQEIKKLDEQDKQAKIDIKELKKDIKNLENMQRYMDNQIRKTAIPKSALHDFSKLIVSAFEQTLPHRKQYLFFTVHNIFLAMLWRKAIDKKDFITYFAHLDKSIFTDNAVLVDNSPAQRSWINQKYAQDSYKSIHPIIQQIQSAPDDHTRLMLLKDNFEALIAAWYSYNVFTSVFPPQVLTGWAQYKGYDFADCGSTSVRNALNNIMFINGLLLLSELNSFKLSDRFRSFHQSYGAVEQIQESKTRNAWVTVTSELGGNSEHVVDYKTPPENGICEIHARSGIKNINNVLYYILGIESVDDFAKLPRVSVSKQLAQDDNFGVYTFIIDGKYTFKWYFEPVHYFVSIDPAFISTDPLISAFMQSIGSYFQIGTTMQARETNNLLISLLTLYRDKISLFDNVITALQNKGLSHEAIDNVISTLFTSRSIVEQLHVIKGILNNAHSRSRKEIIEMLKRLVSEMVDDVKQHYSDIVQTILNTSALIDSGFIFDKDLEDIVRQGIAVLKANYPQLLVPVADSIIRKQYKKFYGTLQKNVPFTPEQLTMIIQNDIEPLHPNVREYIQRLQLPLKEEDKQLIRAIYQQKIEQFYKPLEKKLDAPMLKELSVPNGA